MAGVLKFMVLSFRQFCALLAGFSLLALSLAALALWGSADPSASPVVLPAKTAAKVTIWIHGTNLQVVLPKKLHGLLPPTYQPRRPLDFTTTLLPVQQLGAQSQVRAAAAELCRQDPAHFNLEQFYLLRWSGGLGTITRENAAIDLYTSLTALVAQLTTATGVTPEITIIGHSHGGNVALSLARVYDRAQLNFQVQRLILLACPVLPESCRAAADPLFQEIYVLYSHGDWVQVSDWQDWLQGFSARSFPAAPNLQQASVQRQGQDLDHFGFKQRDFIANLPLILR
ncbi:MAG TPA: hypothetical protein VJJ83_02030, partial [Candidatus Babeliales bacterium]|nr:hypothetical protein [Candidatus Babeliales bacterium]